jgi:hypothetical protein
MPVDAIVRGNDHERFLISRSVFSHFSQTALLLSAHGVHHIELACNVIAKPGDEEGDHSLHIFSGEPTRLVMTNNYFHESAGGIVTYFYDVASNNDVVLLRNHFLFDRPRGDFVGIVPARITAIGNVVVGGLGMRALDGRMITEARDNVFYATRAEAGWEPAPAVPSSWPIEL